MFSRVLSSTAVALAAFQLVSAQTSTDCNPMYKECGDDPALGGSVDVDFTQGLSDLFYEFDGTTVDITDQGAVFTINKETDAPTIGSTKYIFGGKVEVTVQAAPGAGIVTSFVLQSDNLDEIDWEWVGNDDLQVQTNYFGKGDTTTYDRGDYHDVSAPQTSTHTYTIDWQVDSFVKWYVDGALVRELKYADAQGGSRFPQTPMQLRLGTWVGGGKNSPPGTVEWAGGYADFSQAPFIAYYKEIKITDYSNGVDNAAKYSWESPGDGSWESITVITGDGEESSSSSTSTSMTSTTSTPKPTSSSTASTTSEPSSTATSESTTKESSTKTSSTTPTSTSTSSTSEPTPSETGDDAEETPTPTGDEAGSSSTPTPTPGAGVKTALSPVALAAGLLFAVAM